MSYCSAYSLCRHMRRILHLCHLFCNLSICHSLSIRDLQ